MKAEWRLAAAHLPTSGPIARFITHLHTDHTLELPDLIFTSWISRRDTTLPLYDPDALREMDDDVMAAWSEDIDTRLNGLEHESPTGRIIDEPRVRVTRCHVAFHAAAKVNEAQQWLFESAYSEKTITQQHEKIVFCLTFAFSCECSGRRSGCDDDSRCARQLQRRVRQRG